jgi:peptide/nickel transport system substrate-binding protein
MGKLALIKGGAAYSAGEADEVEGIVVVDDHTIRFDQELPNGLFMAEAGATFEREILPKHLLGHVAPENLRQERFFIDSPVGSGPFKLERYVDGQFFRMVAFDDYYLGRPLLDEIIVSIILSSEAAQIAFQRGEFHGMSFDGGTDATTEMFQDAIDDPGTNVAAQEGSTLISYAFNTRVADLIDPRIRQAFLYALDRQKLIDTFVGGNGKIFNSFMTHGWYQKPEWKDMYPFDPDKARQLLAEAGWDSNREVTATIITVGSEEANAMLAAEQAMLADVGFKLNFKQVALGVWVDTFYDTHEWDMIRVTFGVFEDPDGFLNFHVKTGSRNAMGYANPELDAKIENGRRTIGIEERKAIYQEINEEMLVTLPLAPVYLKDFWNIMSRRWYVPGISDMRSATSLADMPTFPIVARTGEIFKLAPHLWDLRAAQ